MGGGPAPELSQYPIFSVEVGKGACWEVSRNLSFPFDTANGALDRLGVAHTQM